MNDQNQNTFLWCKSQFEIALQLFRLGCGELDQPSFGDRRFRAETEQNLICIQNRVANEELIQYYFLALNRKTEGEPDEPHEPSHKVGIVLLEYFQGEGQAIRYLEKVSVRALVRLTLKQRQLILADKIPDHPHIRGPDFKWTDDMWWYIYEMAQSLDFNTPPDSNHRKALPKRKRDVEEWLSDPPCSLRSAGKRVRLFNYYV
jgi:hypothetical protein